LRALGLGDGAIKGRVANGQLHRLHRGVYAVGHARLSREGRWLAAVLACGPGAALSHRSAAALWELRQSAAARIDVTVPRVSGVRSSGRILVHRPNRSTAVTVRDRIPVTTPMQTLADLAELVTEPGLERALEAAEGLRLLDLRALQALDGRGARRAAALAATHDATTTVRSSLEARFLELCHAHGLPRPLVNARIEGVEVDFAWPAQMLIVETDGHRHHGTRAAFERDRARDARLTALGWRVVRITDRRLRDEPDSVAALLRALLEGPQRA
jgi:hypothetical protein